MQGLKVSGIGSLFSLSSKTELLVVLMISVSLISREFSKAGKDALKKAETPRWTLYPNKGTHWHKVRLGKKEQLRLFPPNELIRLTINILKILNPKYLEDSPQTVHKPK